VHMDTATSKKFSMHGPKSRPVAVAVVLVILVALILLIAQIAAPKRSVAAYCQTYRQEKARLAKLPGDTWPSAVFNDSLSDAGQFATSFSRLEKSSPDDIRPDVKTLQSIYQKIHDDPSQAISASLSGTGAEDSVKQWTSSHCSE
jgi:hypothetical protein